MSTRQIKDAVNHSTGELVYFKGHAKATFMSDGKTVEDAINNIEIPTVPTKVSELENDSNYLTEHQNISHLATKQEVSNIDFYNIKDNPIVNNGDGKLLFVDENSYIGLQLEEDGLYVKDVITPEHTLSSKADKSELSNYATKDEVPNLVNDKYTKPSTGIPFSDFEEQVQGSIIKAEESVQSVSMGVTVGNATAGNFFNVSKDANGNVSIQMIQNSLASGKIAIPYTTDVKQYIDNAVANAGGGGGTGGEDIRYFTDFTVEYFIEECIAEGTISSDTTELFNAMKNNKIICVPYENYDKGFLVASYRSRQDFDYPDMYLEKNGVEYYAYTGDDGNLYGSRPYSQNVTVVEIEGSDETIFECLDNHIYKITGYVNVLLPFPNYLQKGTSIHFTTADNPMLLVEGFLWANGVMPSLEPYVTYELSLISSYNGNINAVLTPFKFIES